MASSTDHDSHGIHPCPQCGTGVRFHSDPETNRKSCPHCGYVLPNQIAHFKLDQLIGMGGMGAVYKGSDTSLERPVAVKVMREELARNPQFVENFLREARAVASFSHPNVGQLYSFGEQNSRFYLVMELLPGGSLDDRIEKERRVPELQVVNIGLQVANGLKAAYSRGLIHRDIKPGNILFAADGTAKVVDFGLARLESSQSESEEGIWGTPYYIAPEKVSDNKEDFRSDIYSLGGTLFHAIAGRAPFEAATSTEVVMKHLRAAAVSLQTFAPDCTPETAEVIGRMLKRNPDERPQSYDELLNDLAYAKRFALGKKSTSFVQEKEEYPMGLLVGTLVLFLLSIGAAVWVWVNRDKFFGPSEKPPTIQKGPMDAGEGAAHSQNNNPSLAATNNVQANVPSVPKEPDYNAMVDDAHDIAMRGKDSFPDAIGSLKAIGKNLPPNHALQPWVALDISRFLLLTGKDAEANASLATVAGDYTPISPVKPGQYPQLLALILLGKVPAETRDPLMPSLPPWMQAIARFDAGLAELRAKRLKEASDLWHDYYQAESFKEQSWTLAFQPFARDFVNECDAFQKTEQQVNDLREKKQFADVQKLLQDNQSKWQHPMIKDYIAKIVDTNRQDMVAAQKEDEEKNKAQKENQSKEEAKLVEVMHSKKPGFLAAYQFDQLLASWKDLDSQIKTDENRKTLNRQINIAQCLTDFKNGLVKDITAHPYDQERVITKTNRRMVGKLVQIHDNRLAFRQELAPNQFGEVNCMWSDLPPSAVLELGDFYFLRAQKDEHSTASEIAHRAISLAVLVHEYALPDSYFQRYLGAAEKTGANLNDAMNNFYSP